MSIRTQVFLAICAVVGIALYYFVDWHLEDLTPRYRESTEEPLVDAARILAAVAAMTVHDGMVDKELFRRAFEQAQKETFQARIFDFVKTGVDFRVYITDALGIVIFDSEGGRDEGQNYSQWRDVRLTLEGEYGARTSRDLPRNPYSSVMYVAAPITVDGEVVGVLSVGKPTETANLLVEAAKRKTLIAAAAVGSATLIIGLILSAALTGPLDKLTAYARAVRDGQRVDLPRLRSREAVELGEAFEEMRRALEGKEYVERYVQALTHELKSPIAGIRGAAELLTEDMDPAQRRRFVENIIQESARMQGSVEKLLLLSSLEKRHQLDGAETVAVADLLGQVVKDHQAFADQKRVAVELRVGDGCAVRGDRRLLECAVANLLQNAIEFSSPGNVVLVEGNAGDTGIELRVIDNGPGIPDFAVGRLFERFYSLERPQTKRKSSGLGLSIVKEIAELHEGAIAVKNRTDDRGVVAALVLPRESGAVS